MPPEEEKSQKPLIIAGIVMVVVFVVAIGFVVKFKPQWLGGKALNPLQKNSTEAIAPNIPNTPNTPNIFTTPLPIPTPNLGPGPNACDPLGVCNNYGDTSVSSGCPRTFADSTCLKQCDNKEARCAKF